MLGERAAFGKRMYEAGRDDLRREIRNAATTGGGTTWSVS